MTDCIFCTVYDVILSNSELFRTYIKVSINLITTILRILFYNIINLPVGEYNLSDGYIDKNRIL